MPNKTPKIYLLRHGQTEWSLSGQHTGLTDIALTEIGKEEAQALSKAIKDVKFEKVFSSPLQRAKDTAKIAGLKNIEITSDLLEWNYGEYEGKKTDDIKKGNPHWNLFEDNAPGGETGEDVAKRVDHLIHQIRSLEGNVALVSHGHLLRVFAARWLGLPPKGGKFFYLNTASLSILGYEHDNKNEPNIKLWNSTAHLNNPIP